MNGVGRELFNSRSEIPRIPVEAPPQAPLTGYGVHPAIPERELLRSGFIKNDL